MRWRYVTVVNSDNDTGGNCSVDDNVAFAAFPSFFFLSKFFFFCFFYYYYFLFRLMFYNINKSILVMSNKFSFQELVGAAVVCCFAAVCRANTPVVCCWWRLSACYLFFFLSMLLDMFCSEIYRKKNIRRKRKKLFISM